MESLSYLQKPSIPKGIGVEKNGISIHQYTKMEGHNLQIRKIKQNVLILAIRQNSCNFLHKPFILIYAKLIHEYGENILRILTFFHLSNSFEDSESRENEGYSRTSQGRAARALHECIIHAVHSHSKNVVTPYQSMHFSYNHTALLQKNLTTTMRHSLIVRS